MVNARVLGPLVAASLTLALAACGGGGSGMTPGSTAGSGAGTNIPVTQPTSSSSSSSSVSFGSISTQPFAIGERRNLAPSEQNYGGTFTVTSSNPAVLSVSPRSGAGPFLLTGVASGSATVTAADNVGRHGTLAFTVAAPASRAGATPAPVMTGAPGASPAPVATPTPIVIPIPSGPVVPGQPTPTPIAITVPVNGAGNVDLGAVGNVVASVADPAIASVVSLGNGVYTIVGNAVGQTQVTLTSSSGATLVNVSVPATPPLITVPSAALNLRLLNALGANVAIVSAGEPGSNGKFTASIQNTGIAVVAPIPLTTNQFLVMAVGHGTTFLTLQDALGRTQYLSVNIP